MIKYIFPAFVFIHVDILFTTRIPSFSIEMWLKYLSCYVHVGIHKFSFILKCHSKHLRVFKFFKWWRGLCFNETIIFNLCISQSSSLLLCFRFVYLQRWTGYCIYVTYRTRSLQRRCMTSLESTGQFVKSECEYQFISYISIPICLTDTVTYNCWLFFQWEHTRNERNSICCIWRYLWCQKCLRSPFWIQRLQQILSCIVL